MTLPAGYSCKPCSFISSYWSSDSNTTIGATYDIQWKYSRIPLAPWAPVLEILESILSGFPVVSFRRTQNRHTRPTRFHFLSCSHLSRHHSWFNKNQSNDADRSKIWVEFCSSEYTNVNQWQNLMNEEKNRTLWLRQQNVHKVQLDVLACNSTERIEQHQRPSHTRLGGKITTWTCIVM